MKLTLRAPSTLLCAALALAGVAWWTVPAVAAGTAVNEVRFPLRDLKVWQKGGEAQVLLRGVANRARPGEPELPGGNVAVEIPAGARVTGWQVVPLDPIEVPAQAHLGTLKAWQTGDGQTAHGPAPVQLDPAAWFPGRPFEELHVGFLQGHTVASVAVRPLQYLASQGRLRLVTRFRLSVSYEEAGGTMPLARIRRTERTEAVTARALGALGLPYQPQPNTRVGRGGAFPMAPGQYPGPLGHEAAYLIVTPDSLVSAFQPLADWKTRQGISTRIVTLSQVQASYPQGVDLQEKIRLCVRDAYLYQGTQWLLLGGTGQLIPPRYAASQLLPDAPVPTDIYYSNLDGNWNANANSLFGEAFVDSSTPGDGVDLYPEVYVGRAPVLNTAEATVFVNKTLTYDQNPPNSYLNNQLLFAEVLFPSDYTPGAQILFDGAILAEDVSDSLPSYSHVVKLYEDNDQNLFPGSIYETRAAVLDSLNVGYNLALHVGHGFRNTMSVGAGALVNADWRALTNAPRYSYVISVDCTSGAIDFDCIGAATVTASGGGAFAFWGSTREAFPATGENYLDKYMGIVNADSIGEIGEALSLAKLPFVDASLWDSPDRWTQLSYILLGDPGLRLRLRPSSVLSVVAPATFVIGDPGYTVSVTSGGAPVESALVCVRKTGDDLRAGYTDATGHVTLPFQPDSTGAFQVTVTKRNSLPYLGSGTVQPRGGAYLYDYSATKVILDGSIPPQIGNGDGVVDAGETIQLGVTVGNHGTFGATGVNAVLSTGQAGVSVTTPSVAYGSITAGGTSSGSGYFTVSFARSLRDGLQVPFTLHLTDLQGDARDDYFTLSVRAPVPEHYAQTWVDSVSGGTHYTLLRVTLRNLGSGPFRALSGTVRPVAGSYVPLDTLSSYGNLASGASWIGTKEIRFQGQATALSRFYLFLTDAYGEADTLNFDLSPPGPVANLSGLGSHSSISLTWTSSPDSPSVAGYYIYRAASQLGPYSRVNSRATGPTEYFTDSGLAPLTPYWYYVTAVDSGGLESAASTAINVSTNPQYHTGWPIPTGTEMAGSPVLVNFTHDPSGQLDIVVGSDGVYMWHPDGTELRDGDHQPITSGLWLPRGGGYPGSLAVSASLFGDGHYYVVGLTQDSSNVFVWDENGNVMPGWPHRLLSGFPFGSPAIGDIDGDGKPEIVVACGSYVYAWHRDGTEVVDGDHNPSTNGVIKVLTGAGYTPGSPALADLDGDGKLDIIICGGEGKVHAIRYDGTECRGWPDSIGIGLTGSPAVADLDLDGHLEVVFPSPGNMLYCVSDSGTNKPGWPIPMHLDRTSRSPSPALADLNGDGYLDVVEATTDGYIRAVDRNGANLPGWSNVRYAVAYAAQAGTSESSPIVVDLNGDGHYEVLEGAEDANFYGFNYDGSTLAGFPIRISGEIRGTPAVWDLTNTGQTNIVLSSWDKNVYVWDYPGGFSRSRAPWPMFRHDDEHTGRYANGNIITAVLGAELQAVAEADGIRLSWSQPATAGGRVSWNLYRREDPTGGPGAGPAQLLDRVPADFARINEAPIQADGGSPSYLDQDVRGGRTYVYILETLVEGRRTSLVGPLVRTLSAQFLPARLALFPSAPNPFRASTAMRFLVPAGPAGSALAGRRVRLSVHDISGRLVRRLMDASCTPGSYTQTWDGRDDTGARLASGVYFYRLEMGGEALTRKVLLIR